MRALRDARDGQRRRRGSACWCAVLVALFVVVSVMVPPVVASSERRGAGTTAREELEAFPLWKAVPRSDFAVLREGIRGEVRWGVYAYRRDGSQWAWSHPCIVVATITLTGGYGSVPSCGSLAPSTGASAAPVRVLIGESYGNEVGGKVFASTAFGMTFARQVEKVKIDVEPGKAIALKAKYLSASQARKAHVPRFRYVASSVARDICLKHVAGLDGSSGAVVDADFDECPLLRP